MGDFLFQIITFIGLIASLEENGGNTVATVREYSWSLH
jgi:hypothetical protein